MRTKGETTTTGVKTTLRPLGSGFRVGLLPTAALGELQKKKCVPRGPPARGKSAIIFSIDKIMGLSYDPDGEQR
jgi:hypothetical protein